MTSVPHPLARGNAEAVAALAAITGQTVASATEIFRATKQSAPDPAAASASSIDGAVNRLCTRVGLAPAVDTIERDRHIGALRALTSEAVLEITRGDLNAWDTLLRTVPEMVPTIERDPVVLPAMPDHQVAMWSTLLDFEDNDPPPWVLVGGQMTALHLAEHGVTAYRPTDDGDVVVGV